MGMVPPPLVRPREEIMGYQPPPPERQQRGKAQPKGDNPMDYYTENPVVSRPATWTELLPTSEHMGWPYDPKLISGLSKKEQEQADRWFLGLPDGPGGQSNSATIALMQQIEQRIIPCGPGSDVTLGLAERLSRPRKPELTSIIRKHGGYAPRVQPNPEEVFPLRYRSPVVRPRDKRHRVADHLIINLM